jgi:hypothetical protein
MLRSEVEPLRTGLDACPRLSVVAPRLCVRWVAGHVSTRASTGRPDHQASPTSCSGAVGQLCVSVVLRASRVRRACPQNAVADRVYRRASGGQSGSLDLARLPQSAVGAQGAPGRARARPERAKVACSGRPRCSSCQTAPTCSVRSGPVPRRSKISDALESSGHPTSCRPPLTGATHLHGRFRTEGDRERL